jgi:hypothetical protein
MKNLSRREFARALVATAALPATRSHPQEITTTAEAQAAAILARYGARLSEAERAELRKVVSQLERASQAIRDFPLENSDEPASAFRIYRSDQR